MASDEGLTDGPDEVAPDAPVIRHEKLPIETRLMARQMARMAERLRDAENALTDAKARAEAAEQAVADARATGLATATDWNNMAQRAEDGIFSITQVSASWMVTRIVLQIEDRVMRNVEVDAAARTKLYQTLGDRVKELMHHPPFDVTGGKTSVLTTAGTAAPTSITVPSSTSKPRPPAFPGSIGGVTAGMTSLGEAMRRAKEDAIRRAMETSHARAMEAPYMPDQ